VNRYGARRMTMVRIFEGVVIVVVLLLGGGALYYYLVTHSMD
jgi:hypothetical protein